MDDMDDSTDHEDNEDDDTIVISLEDRLLAVKKAVRKATEEALQQSNSDQPIAQPQFDPTPENIDPNASFLLGMELFGQEPSVLERKIQDKLHEIEEELQQIVVEAPTTTTTASTNADAASTTSDLSFSTLLLSPQDVQEEASRLTLKIKFLQECSRARALLDESITLSSSALTSEPDWVLAAQRLAEAQQVVKDAEAILKPSTPTLPSSKEDQTTPTPALLAAYRIVDSILHPIRRKRVELIAKATTLLESSITITSSSLTVKGGRNSTPEVADGSNNNNSSSASSNLPSHGLSAAFQVLAAFDEQGSSALQEAIRKITKRLVEQVLIPVLNEHRDHHQKKNKHVLTSPWTFQESHDKTSAGFKTRVVVTASSSTNGLTHHLEWHRSNVTEDPKETKANDATPIAAWKETFAFLQRILAFVGEHVLLQRSNLTLLVGKRLFGKPDALPTSLSLEALGIQSTLIAEDHGLLTETILELMNMTCIPTYLTAEQVLTLPAIADQLQTLVVPFEQFLVDKNFLPAPTTDTNYLRLGNFVNRLEQNYIEKRRCTILNEARELLLNNDYHNTVEVGVAVKPNKGTDLEILDDDGMSVFQLHKSCISQTSSKLMELCRKTMDEAVEQPAVPHDSPLVPLAPNLYRTARDILELFRAIIPSSLCQEITHVPRTAALLHNDCVFFSHHCLTLGLEYKDRFPSSSSSEEKQGNLLRQTCLFVDMVPPFRELADRSMGDMLVLQKHQLVEIVGERIIYLGETLPSNESVAEWSQAETALTAGLYHLRHLSQAWRPILSQEVFSRSMGHLADAIFALYLEQVLKATDISESACHFVSALFEKATRSIMAMLNDDTTGSRLWDRFSAVGSFMDMSLADIEAALAQGVFRNVTGPELTRLITATFADSEKRRNLLRLLVVD